jgi:cytochrome P450
MWTDLPAEQLAATPVGELATAAPPQRWHGPLRQLGTHCHQGAWVVSGPRAVAQALASPALGVVPPAAPDGPAARLAAQMARFCDGPEHRRRRELVTRMLPPAADVARAAGARANDYLRRRVAAFDIMPMARLLPAEVLARALGLPPARAERAATLTGALCDALTPSLLPRNGTGSAGDAAAAELVHLMASLGHRDDEHAAAAVSILFQARDATAALIGTAVVAGTASLAAAAARAGNAAEAGGRGPLTAARRVEQVLRGDAPVQCTRRVALAEARVGDAVVPAGATVWVFVATAERGTGQPATFGSGAHACPAAAQAAAIARQVVTVLEADGWRLAGGQRIEYEPRPNLRVPVRVIVTRS